MRLSLIAALAALPLFAATLPVSRPDDVGISAERLKRIGAAASGFLYTVSVTGTTGERTEMDGGLAAVIA